MAFNWAAAGANLETGKYIGSYLGAKQERKGYKRASGILDQLRGIADESREEADPFRQYRGEIAGYLSDLVMGRADVKQDPGYQFAFDESMRGTRRQLAASGLGNSGNVLAALQERAGGLASQQYGQIIDRLMNLSAATPQNAIAGAQQYGGLHTTRITGQAEAAIGSAQAQARQRGALWGGISNAGQSVLKGFGMG